VTAGCATGADYQLELLSVRATISGTGAALRRLSVNGTELTPGFERHTAAPFFCGKVLAPWPNRMRDGRWHHRGRTLQLDITDPEHHAALHGLLCGTEYRLVGQTPSSVTLAAPIRPCDGYPFALDTAVSYQLHTDGIVATQSVRNTGSERAPVALGAHPFLSIGDVPTDELIVTVAGCHHIDVDAQLIPVGTTEVAGTGWDLRDGRRVADLDLDDCWSVPGGSTHTLRAPDGRTVSLCADRHFGYLHVFITRQFPCGDGYVTAIALEPMTAPADAFNSGTGLRWLEPGGSFSASWAIRFADPRSG
jgi:aldose 1-epimerase